jgi:endonuclease/exonuclease/phosphatase (EEP) superfamily protein YafD
MIFLRILLALPILGVGVLSAIAAVAGHGGRTHTRLDVLTHFAPVWLAGGLVALLLCGIAPRGLIRASALLAGLVAVIASAALMAPEYLRPVSRAPAEAPNQLKLIQFNNKQGYTRVKPAAAWILDEKADVVVLE